MIIQNGLLQTVTKSGGGSLNGIPQAVIENIGEPVPCNIKTVRNNLHGKSVDGIFRQTEFEVLILSSTFPVFGADVILLTDNRGQCLGRFLVQDIQFLDFVQAIKIDVCHAD